MSRDSALPQTRGLLGTCSSSSGGSLALAMLLALILGAQLALAGAYTHNCTLLIDGSSKELMLMCQQLAAAAGCNLTVYFNNTNGGFRVDPSSWGVQSAALPAADAASLPRAEALNLTTANATLQPLLYFHGDPGCNILLSAPKVLGVQLPYPYYSTSPPPGRNVSSQVLVFGGGLNATLDAGSFTHNSAHSIVRVLAHSTLHVSGSNVTHNNVTAGVVRCSQSAALQVTNTVFVRGRAYVGGAIAATDCRVDVQDTTFTNNSAVDAVGEANVNQRGAGGACYFTDTTAKITNSNFTHNIADGPGGALHVDGGQLQLQQAHFNHCAARNSGAVYLVRTLARIQKCVFFDNEARIVGVAQSLQRDWAAGVGGAVGVVETDVTFEGCSMQQNWAAADGGRLQHGRRVCMAYMPSRVVYGLGQSCMP